MNGNNLTSSLKRSTGLDLLKITAMFMVILVHCTSHGLRGAEIVPFSAVNLTSTVINSFALVAVNCFVLISGFFLSAKAPNPKKLIPLWIQVLTYSVGIYLVLCLLPESGVAFSWKKLLRQCLPLMSQQYWFFTFYFLMYLFAPYLNKLIHALTQKEYQWMLLTLLVVFSLIPSVNPFGDSFKVNGGFSLTWFLVLYLAAGYIRRWPPVKRKIQIWGYILPCLLLAILRILIPVLGTKIPFFTALVDKECSYNAPLIFIASVSLFLWAESKSAHFTNRMDCAISGVAALSFGVYLLHDHRALSPFLWEDVVKLSSSVKAPVTFILRFFIAAIAIFLCGIVVEWVRKFTYNCLLNMLK